MHIHWIANTIVPPPISLSGGDRIMAECIRRWSQDHKITVYGNEGARQLCDWFELKGIEHVTWPADHLKKYGRLFWWFMQMVKGNLAVRDLQFSPNEKHLIMATSEFHPSCIPAMRLKKRYPNAPLVVGLYFFAPKWFSGQPGPGFMFTAYRPFQQQIYKRTLREAEMILTTVVPDRELMIADGRSPESVFAVLGGVDLSIPQGVPEPKEKTFDAVFISRLHPQKGPMELMDVWKILTAKKPNARLAMIGSGPLDAQCKAKAEKLGIAKNVEFFGFHDGWKNNKSSSPRALWYIRRYLKWVAWDRRKPCAAGCRGYRLTCRRCGSIIRAAGSKRRREILQDWRIAFIVCGRTKRCMPKPARKPTPPVLNGTGTRAPRQCGTQLSGPLRRIRRRFSLSQKNEYVD